jgi:hypothetical protein
MMSQQVVAADSFHPMRGHVADGAVVLFADGSTMTLSNTMRGWTLLDDQGRQAFNPIADAIAVASFVTTMAGQRMAHPHRQ